MGGGWGECGWGVSVFCAWTDILCTNVLLPPVLTHRRQDRGGSGRGTAC